MVKAFSTTNVNCTVVTEAKGITLLPESSLYSCQRAMCSTLIECGANVDLCDSYGITAAQVACYHGHKEPLSVLFSNRATVNIMDRMVGNTPNE